MSWEFLGIELLKASVVGPSLLVGMGATALFLFKVRHPGTRHTVWTAVLAGMLLIPFLGVVGPRFDLRVLPAQRPAVPDAAPARVTSRPIATPSFEPATTVPSPTPMAAAPAPIPVAPRGRLRSIRMEDVVLGLYLMGLTVVGVRLAAGRLLLRRVLSRSTSRFSGLLRESPDVAAPVTVGLLRPVVLLPVGWGRSDVRTRRAVLAHEFAHVRRKDTWTSALAFVVRSLLWFHPLAWWARREAAQLSELACDLVALETTVSPAAYAELLVDWAKAAKRTGYRVSLPGLAVLGSAGLSRRIDQALAFSRGPGRPRKLGVILALAGLPAISLATTVTLSEKPAVASLAPVQAPVQVSGPILSVPPPSPAPSQLEGKQAGETPRDPATVAVISGRLSLSDGAPAPNIEVTAFQKETPPNGALSLRTIVGRTRTDANGLYRIEIPTAGSYGVSAVSTFYPGVPAYESARLVQIAIGQTVSSVDFALDRSSGVRVRGRIVPPPGAAGAVRVGLGYPDPDPDLGEFACKVNFWGREYDFIPGLPLAVAAVAADGSFEFPLVQQGAYTARVLDGGAAPLKLGGSSYAGRRIAVRDAEVNGVEISAAGIVTGQLRDKAGVLVVGIRVIAVEADPSSATGTGTPYIARSTKTDADGRYRLNDLPSGGYYIQIGSPDSPTYFPGVSAPTEARALTIAPGETIANVDFRLDGVRVTGQVTGIGQITPSVWRESLRIMLLEPNQAVSSPGIRSVPVGPNGAFQFSAIPPGTYRLTMTGTTQFAVSNRTSLIQSCGLTPRLSSNVAVLRVDGQRDIEGLEVPFANLVNPPVDGIATIPVPAPAAPPLFRVRGRVVAFPGVELPRQIQLHSFAADRRIERVVPAEVHRDGSFEFQRVPEGMQELVLEDWRVSPGAPIYGDARAWWSRGFSLKGDLEGFEVHTPAWVSGRLIMDGGAALPAGATILSTQSPSAPGGAVAGAEVFQMPQGVAPDGSFGLYVHAGEQNITVPSLPGYAVTITFGNRTSLGGLLRIDGPLPKTPLEIRLTRLP